MGRRQLGQETAEAGRRSGRSGLDPGPTHTQPYQSSREQRGVSKNIYSESNLMRYCISADNGRMWGWALQGRRPMHSAAGTWGRPALQLKEEVKACTSGPSRPCRHTALSRMPGAHPPLEQEHVLDPHDCKEHCQPASPPPPVWKSLLHPSLKATQGPLEYLC